MATSNKKDVNALSFEELAVLNERKEAIKKDHESYVNDHPEIKTLLSAYMSAVLMEKPEDVLSFTIDFFSTYKPSRVALAPLVVAGPSGVGKGTIIEKLLKKYPDLFGFSVSHTTRGPRPGEKDGVSYHFTTVDKMQENIDKGLFLEHAAVHGNFYGTSKEAVKKVQHENKICVLDIDIQGVQQVKASGTRTKQLFIAPPSVADLESRLHGRGTETEEKIALRVKNAVEEIRIANQPGMFDAIIVNKDLEECFENVVATLKAWYPDLDFS